MQPWICRLSCFEFLVLLVFVGCTSQHADVAPEPVPVANAFVIEKMDHEIVAAADGKIYLVMWVLGSYETTGWREGMLLHFTDSTSEVPKTSDEMLSLFTQEACVSRETEGKVNILFEIFADKRLWLSERFIRVQEYPQCPSGSISYLELFKKILPE